MTLKEFCTVLKQCADKLEEEIKYNINDVHNLIYSNKLNETKMALEKAKDYHYKEIMDSMAEILKNIKKILFHQDKIEWLGNENHFTKDELRRFSYVKRQVYAFSNNEDTLSIPTPSIKKEKRRTASEISIGTLTTWEKYLDQKDIEEKGVEETVAELKPLVPKRTLSNARRRKKFVSSTMGGFLEGDGRSRNLDSIFEDVSSTEDNDRLSISKSLESLDSMVLNEEQKVNYCEVQGHKSNQNNFEHAPVPAKSNNGSLVGSLESLHNLTCGNEIGSSSDISKNRKRVEIPTITDDKEESLSDSQDQDKLPIDIQIESDIMNIVKESMPIDEETIKSEIMNSFLKDITTLSDTNAEKLDVTEPNKEKIKPKIVDVIFKKKTT